MREQPALHKGIRYFNEKEVAYIIKHHTREVTRKTCGECGGYMTVTSRFDGLTFANTCHQCGYGFDWDLLTGEEIKQPEVMK